MANLSALEAIKLYTAPPTDHWFFQNPVTGFIRVQWLELMEGFRLALKELADERNAPDPNAWENWSHERRVNFANQQHRNAKQNYIDARNRARDEAEELDGLVRYFNQWHHVLRSPDAFEDDRTGMSYEYHGIRNRIAYLRSKQINNQSSADWHKKNYILTCNLKVLLDDKTDAMAAEARAANA